MVYGLLTYLLWGLFPAYFPMLEPASPLEILSHRILWAMVIMVIYLSLIRGWRELTKASVRTWGVMGLAGFLIAINWFIYILAVNSGHVADAALGYFINPLVSVALGMFLLDERLRKLQITAVVVAIVGVLYLALLGGHPPYISLALALSFGFYGLLKKKINISAAGSLTAETITITPFALAYIMYLSESEQATFLHLGLSHDLWLLSSGLVTAIPLLLFGLGAKELTLSTIGMLQYLTPSLQLLWAVYYTHEAISPQRWLGFLIIWLAVAIYLLDLLQHRPKKKPQPTG
ncbi:EamA family transporter RarD [Corynebacterium sp. 3HC-13]|uniref:EamA family transporter RarD n=1 Tax=Corynebacterium poyangense TaxID=2684405 RepID=UPI001CCDB269|nr:EamA family transporter RarD [Corynebacterium poyangense]MBZ8178128.1 EamA family transporter RarD [Corynebacterium poyangense]